MSEPASILRCTDIHKSFLLDSGRTASLEVLKGIDLDVKSGEMIAILGASGSGKSTLLHILGGLDRPTRGSVFWAADDIFRLGDEALATLRGRSVGFVFQFHHLLPEFTALENVMIPQMIVGVDHGQARRRAEELLVKVHLEQRSEHRPAELSGGEQQRVAVARALANRPQIILADEPSGNLDSENSSRLHELLRQLNKAEGQTFVIVTHNELLAGQSDRSFRMMDGKLQSAGS